MKAIILIASLFLAISCSGPQSYVNKAVKIMDKQGLFAEGQEWEEIKKITLDSKPVDLDEAQEVVKEALKIAGGKHSFIYPADRVNQDSNNTEWEMPTVVIDDNNVVYIKLPRFHGNSEEGVKYARTVIDAVPDDVKGAIVDLRQNTGGNMFPMIAAVHRFISDGDNMLRFRSRKRTQWIPLSYVCMSAGVDVKAHIDCPVAIITDNLTASSAEATLLCFRGQENTKTFGAETAGYASANTPFAMPDGSSLVLTTGCDVARTNEEFCDDPIVPNVITDDPEIEATNWIMELLIDSKSL